MQLCMPDNQPDLHVYRRLDSIASGGPTKGPRRRKHGEKEDQPNAGGGDKLLDSNENCSQSVRCHLACLAGEPALKNLQTASQDMSSSATAVVLPDDEAASARHSPGSEPASDPNTHNMYHSMLVA
ncbi:hypothetical protein ABBQ32_008700 [Trebouxia sp. C0010 RCD-2024]